MAPRSGPAAADLPEPLTGAVVLQELTIEDVPDSEALAATLEKWGVSTQDWGLGNTKEVGKYWKEIKEQEAGLEIWRTPDGKTLPVRVTHVLRAKVSAPDAYQRGIFLFNTWQQYGDGRQRTRNGLLSEKLTTSEMPLRDNLHEVCQRAVTEEEMQRVVDSAVRITAYDPAPMYDPDYKCPLQVIEEHFVDHTIEVEKSKSYPGMLTVYNLYTVDIICSGLPPVDFNTLEFDHLDKNGKRKLKYVHAWVWLQWSKIQRYLFEGSIMKERKTKGSFESVEHMTKWLEQFGLKLEDWGQGKWKRVADLYDELERNEAQLEHWGRQDGVPLLMRVVHVIQCKVSSEEARRHGRFLFQVWHQKEDGSRTRVNRALATKLSTAELPFEETRFVERAKQVVQEKLSYVTDQFVQLSPDRRPSKEKLAALQVTVEEVAYSDHRYDMESSPSFKGLITMYHLYTVEVECRGLPSADFASICFNKDSVVAMGWRWVTWQQSLDILHQEMQELEHRRAAKQDKLSSTQEACQACLEELNKTGLSDALRAKLQKLSIAVNKQDKSSHGAFELPPPMVANLADRSLLDEALLAQQMAGGGGGKERRSRLSLFRGSSGSVTSQGQVQGGPSATSTPAGRGPLFPEVEEPAEPRPPDAMVAMEETKYAMNPCFFCQPTSEDARASELEVEAIRSSTLLNKRTM